MIDKKKFILKSGNTGDISMCRPALRAVLQHYSPFGRLYFLWIDQFSLAQHAFRDQRHTFVTSK